MTPVVLFFSPRAPDNLDQLQEDGFIIHIEDRREVLQGWRQAPQVVVIDFPDDSETTETLCTAVRRQFRFVPLLVVTANDPAARQTALEAGAGQLLTAPLDVVELRNQLRLAVGHQLSMLLDADALGHDLKGSLGTVISSLDLMREMLRSDEVLHPLAQDALQAAMRQNLLIENMIDYIRMEGGEVQLELSPLPVAGIVEAFEKYTSAILARKSIDMSVAVSDEVEDVQAQQDVLLRVLKSLFDNALKFCTRDNHVALEINKRDTDVCFSIVDDGRPILPEYLDTIFAPPDQFKKRLNGSRTSVAMNLPYARTAVRLMGGDIHVSSDEAQTRFDIILPAANAR